VTQSTITTDAAKRHHLDKRAGALADQAPGSPDDLLDTHQLADWLGVSTLWVEQGRSKGYGPRFMKLSFTHERPNPFFSLYLYSLTTSLSPFFL
jgi:hypothetical protein